MSARRVNPRIVAIVLGVAVLLAVMLFAVTRGLGADNVPSGDVAVVDGKGISKQEFDRAFHQAALRQGLQQDPQPGQNTYNAIRDQAMGDLLDIAWIQAEAADRGVEVSDREVQQSLQQTKQQNFKTEAAYQQFLKSSGFTQEDVDLRVRLNLLSQKIQQEVSDQSQQVSEDDARKYYDANKSSFEQPESRDVRLILNKDKAQAEKAKSLLEQDDSASNWNKVAAQYSTDATTKNNGGLRQSVTQGVLPGALDGAVFGAPEGQVEGPVQTPLGYYVYEVESVTPGGTQSFGDVSKQIQQQLTSQRQQEDFSAFLSDYRDKWIQETVCASGYVIDRCDNFTPPETADCTEQQIKQSGCAAPVVSTSPGAPGAFRPFLQPTGLPQRPRSVCDPPFKGDVPTDYKPPPACPATGVPGAIPGQIPGATPGATPGTTPGATAPPSG